MESTKSPLFPELRAWMERTGTRQKDIARLLECSDAQVTKYLDGSDEMPLERCIKLSLLADVPVECFLKDRRPTARLLKLWGERTKSSGSLSKESDNVV